MSAPVAIAAIDDAVENLRSQWKMVGMLDERALLRRYLETAADTLLAARREIVVATTR